MFPFSWLLSADNLFMPHGMCFLWNRELILLNVGADLLIMTAYFSIPAALAVLAHKRQDLGFNWMFWLFCAFIFSCGLTHLMHAVNIWHNFYHLEAYLKLMTAAASVTTACMLWPLIPKAVKMPSLQDLQAVNKALAMEIERRQRVEAELLKTNEYLEARVQERTQELQTANQELAQLAYVDPLTELLNRRLFFDRIEHAIRLVERQARSFALLYLDMDDFKQVNDQHGHQAGDAVLREIGHRIRSCLRTADTAARLGGDEFAILLEHTHREEAMEIARRLVEIIRQPIVWQEQTLNLTLSVGLATFPEDAKDLATLLAAADAALYSAKAKGKNQLESHTHMRAI